MSIAAVSLLKETKQAVVGSSFNYSLFSAALADLNLLFKNAQGIALKGGADRSLLLVYHSIILRIQRILVATLMKHLHHLLMVKKDSYTPHDAKELKLLKSREAALNGLKAKFPSLDLFAHGCRASDGPRKLFCLVRVLEGCGVIQTERGFLSLDAESLHFVHLDDVRHLVAQGKLEVVE